jgi:AmiR/NasT family two-component response regulator
MDEPVDGWDQLTSLLGALDDDLDGSGWGKACLRVLADLVGVAASCIATADGELVASSYEESPPDAVLDTIERLRRTGPALEARRSGRSVAVPDLTRARWPDYAAAAASVGIRAVAMVPIDARHLDAPVISLYSRARRAWSETDLALAHFVGSLVARFGAISDDLRRERVTVEQLQNALNSRVVIEQAKGVLAAAGGIDVEAAFELLRRDARRQGAPLKDVARAVVEDGYRPAALGPASSSAG